MKRGPSSSRRYPAHVTCKLNLKLDALNSAETHSLITPARSGLTEAVNASSRRLHVSAVETIFVIRALDLRRLVRVVSRSGDHMAAKRISEGKLYLEKREVESDSRCFQPSLPQPRSTAATSAHVTTPTQGHDSYSLAGSGPQSLTVFRDLSAIRCSQMPPLVPHTPPTI